VGINGHLAFNEPPEPEDGMSDEAFRELSSRVLSLSRETITINSNTALRGAFDQIPQRAVTVGFKQIMASRRLRIYLNRPWQSAVIRKLLFAPQGAYFPATFARTHPDVRLTLTGLVAERPQFALK
jgi:glucosamine-6-phosphate deaminase